MKLTMKAHRKILPMLMIQIWAADVPRPSEDAVIGCDCEENISIQLQWFKVSQTQHDQMGCGRDSAKALVEDLNRIFTAL